MNIEHEIVPARPEEAPQIVEYLNQLAREAEYVCIDDKGGFWLTPEQEAEVIRETKANGNGVILIVKDKPTDDILGSGTAFSRGRRAAHVFDIGVSVASRAQRRGIGRELLEALKDEAQKLGAEKLWLEVCAPNEAAIRLYEKAGFKQEGRAIKAFRTKQGDLIDEILMGYFYQ